MNALRAASALALFAASALTAGCGEAKFHETKVSNAPDVPGSAVRVESQNGSITVDAGGPKSASGVWIEADVFAVTAERAAAVKIVSDRDAAGALTVRAEWPDGRRESNEGCSFRIEVPGTTRGLRATTSNGSVHVRGPCGAVSARTSNGSIEVLEATGRVEAKSSNGRVTATLDDANEGPATLETSNGAIRLTVGAAFRGALSAQTSNGTVEIDVTDLKTRTRTRVEGAKTGEAVIGVGGDASRLKTSNGSIHVESRAK